MNTHQHAIAEFGQAIAAAVALRDCMPPRQAAEAAHTPGGPSVAELERQIRVNRGMPAVRADVVQAA